MSEEEQQEEVTEEEETVEEEKKEKPKGFSEKEVNKRIEQARKQEKDKLYDTITSLKDQVTQLSDLQKQEQEEKEQLAEEAKKQAEKERLANLSSEEKLVEQMKKIEEQLAHERVARERLEETAKTERQLRELEQYKSELLREAGDEIIPELVTGESREEIETNAALAKARYQDIFERTTEKAKGKTPRMPAPTDPDPSAMEEAELAKLDNLSIDPLRFTGAGHQGRRGKRDDAYVNEMEDRRKELFSQIEKAYKKSIGQ